MEQVAKPDEALAWNAGSLESLALLTWRRQDDTPRFRFSPLVQEKNPRDGPGTDFEPSIDLPAREVCGATWSVFLRWPPAVPLKFAVDVQ